MRNYCLVLPIVTLSACSMFENPVLNSENIQTYPSHNQYVYAYGHNAGNYPVGIFVPTQNFSTATYQNIDSNVGIYGTSPYPPRSNRPAGAIPSNQAVCCTHGPQHRHVHQPHLRGSQNLVPAMSYGPFTAQPSYGYNPVPYLRGMRRQNTGNFYGTVGAVLYDDDSEIFGIEGRVGYDSGRIFGAELEGSLGVINEKNTVNEPAIGDVDLNIKSNYNVAAFAVARAPIYDRLSVHGRAGYDVRQLRVNGKAEDGTSVSISGDLQGFAYGAGVEYAVSPQSGLRFDVTRYENKVGSIESISASFTRKF